MNIVLVTPRQLFARQCPMDIALSWQNGDLFQIKDGPTCSSWDVKKFGDMGMMPVIVIGSRKNVFMPVRFINKLYEVKNGSNKQ